MLIDCDTCTVRSQGCADCVVTVLLGAPPGRQGSTATVVPLLGPSVLGPPVDLDDVEQRAVRALAQGGLIPPLRHQPPPNREVG